MAVDLELVDYLFLINYYDDLLEKFDCGVKEINEEFKKVRDDYSDKRLRAPLITTN
ncbi:MAG: hypothetical protein ACFWTQ_05925 [Lactococcus sp.]|jgi:hypothetical protein